MKKVTPLGYRACERVEGHFLAKNNVPHLGSGRRPKLHPQNRLFPST